MKKRDLNLDLIRCFAVFFVISVHFYKNTGLYDVTVSRMSMYLMVAIRVVSMMCIPLFLMLTGYLMCKKELNAKYYKGIIRILLIHGICVICNYLYRHFFEGMELSVKTIAVGMFANQGYSWYIGLYMDLFLLIPFLNLIYNNLDTRRKKRVLLITMTAITALPSAANYFFHCVPDSFTSIYPVTYFFIGAYIREYKPEVKNIILFAVFCAVMLISIFTNIAVSYGKKFAWTAFADWGGMGNALTAPLLFMVLSKINLEKIPKAISKCITKISELSLGLYLLSWIFDTYAYNKLAQAVTMPEERYKYYIIMVCFVFVCSLLLSWVVDIICKLLMKAGGNIWKSLRNTRKGDKNVSI